MEQQDTRPVSDSYLSDVGSAVATEIVGQVGCGCLGWLLSGLGLVVLAVGGLLVLG